MTSHKSDVRPLFQYKMSLKEDFDSNTRGA